tara:strand:- start:95 stop:349 length:255 start_codon:yes stop_codon:yes gene_type:complete
MNELELLKSRIKYRSSYRGTKEMDILLSSFVKAVVENLSQKDLIDLSNFINLNDEEIYAFYQNQKPIQNFKNQKILSLFRNFKI